MQHHLADFHGPLELGGRQVLFPAEAGEAFTLLPRELELAEEAPGVPAFGLELVRPAVAPAFGRLSMRVRPEYPASLVLPELRARYPEARLRPALFGGGTVRFAPSDGLAELPAELCEPRPLGWSSLVEASFACRLPERAAAWVLGALRSDALAVRAIVEVELPGIAARAPVGVEFDPATLTAWLRRGAQEELLEWEALRARFLELDAAPVALSAPLPPEARHDFAAAMADRVYTRFGAFVPTPPGREGPVLRLPQADAGRFSWDLSQREPARRPLGLALNPLLAVRRLATRGVEEFVRQSAPPPLPRATRVVEVEAMVTEGCLNLERFGVDVRSEARPGRPAATRQAEFAASPGRASVELRLLPSEPLRYTCAPYVLLKTRAGHRRFDGPATAEQHATLRLYPHDFPVRFLVAQASPELLAAAEVDGVCSDGPHRYPFTLSPAAPAVSFAQAPDLPAEVTFSFVARARGRAVSVALGPIAPPIYLEHASFAEYGVQRVAVECAFAPEALELAVFEFQAEGESATQAMAFTRANPSQTFSYVPREIFAARYRHRPRGGSWSDYLDGRRGLRLVVASQHPQVRVEEGS